MGYGDSGGPHLYSDDPDYDLVVAVTTGVDPNLQAMSANTRLDTPIVLDWLETFM